MAKVSTFFFTWALFLSWSSAAFSCMHIKNEPLHCVCLTLNMRLSGHTEHLPALLIAPMMLHKWSKWAPYQVNYVIQSGPWPEHRRQFLFMAPILCLFSCSYHVFFLRSNSCIFSTATQKTEAFSFFFPFSQSFVHQQKSIKEYIAISTSSDALIC